MSYYVDQFFQLKCSSAVLNTVWPIGNSPSKEISEAMGVITVARKITLSRPNTFSLVDVCSGNALIPVIAQHLLKVTNSVAIDKKSRERNWDFTRNFEYIMADATKDEARRVIASQDGPVILTSCHACRNLAEHIIEIYLELDNARYLILCPCCINRASIQWLDAYRPKIGIYGMWTVHLAAMARGRVKIDKRILSPMNALIIASKEGCDEGR
jgi:hypothetical protein